MVEHAKCGRTGKIDAPIRGEKEYPVTHVVEPSGAEKGFPDPHEAAPGCKS
jgi:hypothetical protein